MDLEKLKDDLLAIYHDKNGPHDITLKETALAANDSIVDLQLRIATLEAALVQIQRIANTYPDDKAILKVAIEALEGKNGQ